MLTPATTFLLCYKSCCLFKVRRREGSVLQVNPETGVYVSQWASGFDQSKFVLGMAAKCGVNSIIASQHDTHKIQIFPFMQDVPLI